MLELAFAELRSTMNTSLWDHKTRSKVWSLSKQAHRYNADTYHAQWLPYMRGFAHHWSVPLLCTQDHHQTLKVLKLLPFAKTSLTLQAHYFTDLWWTNEPWVSHVSAVNLSHVDLTSQHARQIPQSTHFPALQHANLSLSVFDELAWTTMMRWLDVSSLRHLELGRHHHHAVLDPGELVQPHFTQTLEHLSCPAMGFEAQGTTKLCSTKWPHLRHLNLSGNAFERRGVAALLNGKNFPNLETLNISHCNVTNNNPAMLLNHGLPSLKMLKVSKYPLSKDMRTKLKKADQLRGIIRFC